MEERKALVGLSERQRGISREEHPEPETRRVAGRLSMKSKYWSSSACEILGGLLAI
jgi:hypothetical protein